MSKKSGNVLGIFFCFVGLAACFAGYERGWASVFIGGLITFGVAAFLLDSKSMKDALTGFRDSAGDLIPGRRSTDTSEIRIQTKRHHRNDGTDATDGDP